MTDDANRREFLRTASATVAVAGVAGCLDLGGGSGTDTADDMGDDDAGGDDMDDDGMTNGGMTDGGMGDEMTDDGMTDDGMTDDEMADDGMDVETTDGM